MVVDMSTAVYGTMAAVYFSMEGSAKVGGKAYLGSPANDTFAGALD